MARTALVTGVRGYLGGRVGAALEQQGWRVVGMTREPGGVPNALPFHLGDDVSPDLLRGADALVHCAYDFAPTRRADIWRVNVRGSERLLQAARTAGVSRTVYISSISAYPGCVSLYGQAKLEIERLAASAGAVVVRPGLVFGEQPGAMFGRLVRSIEGSSVIPLVGDGSQRQYLVHEQDLCNALVRLADDSVITPSGAITVAHERPWTLREILERLAAARGRRLRTISVPWRLVWAGLKIAELLGVPLPFKSDSVVSLVHQNPSPDFGPLRQLGVICRPFGADGSGGPSRI